jgi:hypothetical protein
LFRHLIVYATVIGVLAVINAMTFRGHLWFFGPLVVWGFGVAAHALVVWSIGPPRRRFGAGLRTRILSDRPFLRDRASGASL